jgi:MFS family permease
MDSSTHSHHQAWYAGITRYQWLVLLIASLGWVFDVFEGQIFVASMREAMPELLPQGTDTGVISFYNNIALGSFLLGGAAGGILFGMASDRIGRTRTMIFTILMYSVFTSITAFAQSPWQMICLRFLVAMGVGGEWAVASAMVAEVFPKRARAWSLGIFHASSVLGTYMAVAVGAFVVGNPSFGWRWGFVVGAVPALLTVWIRWKLHEPEEWVKARKAADEGQGTAPGKLSHLFRPNLMRHTLVGVTFAAVGLATFWGVHIYGKDLFRRAAEREVLARLEQDADASAQAEMLQMKQYNIKRAEMIGMFLVTTGGGLGLLAFGPLSEWLGRRGAFLLFHLGAMASSLLLFLVFADAEAGVLYLALPIFGFLTLGMHAGYAVYFPELFPTRLRGTGGGFCFNAGRILAAPVLVLSGWMLKDWGFTPAGTASLLSLLFLIGMIALWFAPETKGRELPT